jgi:hypothetical protein
MSTDVSEEYMTSIFRVEIQTSKKPTYNRYLDTYGLHGAISQKMAVF